MDALQETRHTSEEFNPCLLASLRFLSSLASFVALSIAVVVLVGWIAQPSTLVLPEYRSIVMGPNTALAFILCVICMWVGGPGERGARRVFKVLCAAIVFLLGAITVVEHVFDLRFPTDYLLLAILRPDQTLTDAWRMASLTGIGLVFISFSLIAAMQSSEISARAAQLNATVPFLAALVGLVDLLINNPLESQVHMPVTTVLGLALMSIAILLWRPYEGVMRVIAANGLGGSMARRLVPAAIVVSVLITWLRWRGQTDGYYQAELGAALGVAIQVILFAWLILANANYLEEADQLRKRAEEVAYREYEKTQQRAATQIAQLLARAKELERQREDRRATSP